MKITLIKVEAPRRLEGFVKRITKSEFPQWRDRQERGMQQVIDLLWHASARLEQFMNSGRKQGQEVAMGLLKDAQSALAMAISRLGEISSTPVSENEDEEEKVCRKCGGLNVSVGRDLIDDVFAEIEWNHGKVGTCLIPNVFAAWYRVTREIRRMEKKHEFN